MKATTDASLVSGEQPGALASAIRFQFKEHPTRSAIIIFILYLVFATLAGVAAKALLPQVQPEFTALVVMSVLVAIALTLIGWWHEAGFNPPAQWRDVRLMWFPFLVVLVLPFLAGVKTSDGKTFLYLVVAYALTGFMEEGLMRGIVLRVLRPTGITRSVVLSSLLFGLIHIGNLLYRNPFIVLAQMVGAFVHGIGLSAIRYRTNTIWFPVVLHALHDLALNYTNFPSIPLDVVQVTLLMIYGIYLLRTWKTPDPQAQTV
jgi:membrane protease YdiL (CAAX protease family)